jgi:uncharacterized membrane protein
MRIEESIVIDRTCDEVFAFLEARDNDARWMSAVRASEWLEPADRAGVGRRGRMTLKSLAGVQSYVDEVIDYEPGRRIAHRTVNGPIQLGTACLTAPEGAGCRATVVAEAAHLGELAVPGIIGRLASPVLALLLRRGFRADLARLKRILEVPEPSEVVVAGQTGQSR